MQGLVISDMMVTHVKTVFEDDSLSLADWDMVVGEVRHLIVVDRDRHLVGLVSDRDVLRGFATHGGTAILVGRVMTRDVRAVPPTLPAVEAAALLLLAKHGALPVVAADHTVLGIVTTTDFVELARRALVGLDVHQVHARA